MKHLTFRVKLSLIICLFSVFIVLTISFLNYRWYSSQLTAQTIGQTQQIIEQTGNNIETYLNELYRLTLAPYYNDTVLRILEQHENTPEETLNDRREVEYFLSSVMTLPRDEILRVYIITPETIYSYTRTPYEMEDYDNCMNSSWFKEALETTKPIYIPPHLEKAFGERKTPVFSIVRQIRSKEDNNKILGVIKVDADYTGIKKICDRVKQEESGNLIVLNNEDQIIYQTASISDTLFTDQAFLDNTAPIIYGEKGSSYIYNSYSMEPTGLKIIAINSYDELMRPSRSNLERTIFLALSCILATIIFISFFIKRFLSPLSKMARLMREVEQGNLTVRISVNNHDEIGYLASSFNRMTDHLQQFIAKNTALIKEVYETQYLYKESQYNALCSQIKPHFLYNTLNTVNLLIKCGENRKAIHAIEDFSCYLGGVMNIEKEISLKKELQICQAYLSIIQLRYEDKMSYSIQTDKNLENLKIPSLTIQPLVENSVKYGCETKRGKTDIFISVSIAGENCIITVSDTGSGMSSDTLSALQKKLHIIRNEKQIPSGETQLNNIGLANICRRLFLKYGTNADLTIRSSDAGTVVVVTLPISK